MFVTESCPSTCQEQVPTRARLLPLGALLLAASAGSWAQGAASPEAASLSTVTVKDKAEVPEGRDSLRTRETRIGRGTQDVRDVPQSLTVVTEKLIDDRNLDTLKDVLRNTAGVTFQAGEGGEEDVRLRGFSLAGTGDIFLDGLRDPAFYDRDTFNQDRVEVMRGSASMLFGRGSTGGAVNQVSKVPRLVEEHEVSATVGSHQYRRVTGDFNWVTGEDAALRLNVMRTAADNNGAGTRIDKEGGALSYRLGIGTRDEFMASLFWLDNHNGINYGMPWIRPTATSPGNTQTLLPGLSPTAYYGMASDRNDGNARMASLVHLHRFDNGAELRTQVRQGRFERDQRASTIRLLAGTSLANFGPDTALTRGTQLKIQDLDSLQAQTDLSAKATLGGWQHELQAGADASRDRKTVYAARTAAQGGVDLLKPNTSVSTPGDGASIPEDLRVLRVGNQFEARSAGAYLQDLVTVAPGWKLLGGVRFDSLQGQYRLNTLPATAAGPESVTRYQQSVSEWSHRIGALYQPTERHSFHVSWGTSFNTSGDTYSYNAQSANTPPESSQNLELGGRIESADKRFSTRFAVFRATKLNERNTDPDTAATRLLLSGKRHTAGLEIDVSGRITPRWQVFGSYMWMPVAVVDAAASTATTAGNRVGDRPGLSPRHSGTVWTTYQVAPQWRLGGGVTFRSRQAPADATAPVWEAPGFATVDVMAEYTVNDSTTLKANVSNLGNKYYAESLYRGHYVPGAGRLLQLALTTRF